MSENIPIPPAVVEAAALKLAEGRLPEYSWADLDDEMRGMYREDALTALRAGLAAWPGMSHAHNEEGEIKDWAIWYALPWHRAEISNGIILPFTENSNDKA